MIQILGLRAYKKGNKYINAEKFFEKNWRAPSISTLFANLDSYIKEIPEEERYNLFYTASLCHESPGRKLKSQNIIPLDIDGVDSEKVDSYLHFILDLFDLDPEKTGQVFSGNGLQIIIESSEMNLESPTAFDDLRIHYKEICEKINKILNENDLPGHADPSIWTPGRLLRLPGTDNIKTPRTGYLNKNSKNKAYLIQKNIEPQKITLKEMSSLEEVDEKTDIIKHFSTPDTEEVLASCEFLKWCKERQSEVSESQWYAMLSITSRLHEGVKLSHEYSEEHPGYNKHETDRKIQHALKSAGPRTCENISTLTDACFNCEYFNSHLITSPIQIKGENYIATADTGFYSVKISKGGKITPGRPAYDDLKKQFEKDKGPYIATDSQVLYTWAGTHWELFSDALINQYAERMFNPKPSTAIVNEFRNKLFRDNIVTQDWFNHTTENRINLQNGILDLTNPKKPQLNPHSPEHGFLSVADYNYDPKAVSPTFNQFLRDVSLNRPEIQNILLEFIAYGLIDRDCSEEKALILLGYGKNGKSKFIELIQSLVGEQAYTTLSMADLQNDQSRALLHGKMFNFSEETPSRSLIDSSVFKTLISGGSMLAKIVYKAPFVLKNRSKMIFSCNELPYTPDATYGMLRKMLIVPFDAVFEGENQDKHILKKLNLERSGILNEVIKVIPKFMKSGFTDSRDVDEELESFQEMIDPIYSFIKHGLNITGQESEYVTLNALYDAFCLHCDDLGLKKFPTKMTFSKRINTKLLQKIGAKKTTKKVDGKRFRAITGVTLKECF
jgi:putative DNA primase/helicase